MVINNNMTVYSTVLFFSTTLHQVITKIYIIGVLCSIPYGKFHLLLILANIL